MKSKKYLATAILFLHIIAPLNAQAQGNDETDLSRYKLVDEGKGLPTMPEFKNMEDETLP